MVGGVPHPTQKLIKQKYFLVKDAETGHNEIYTLISKGQRIFFNTHRFTTERKIKISANYMVSTPFFEIENEYMVHGKK